MAMAAQWSPDLAVGVALIDQQHQELFRRFHELLDACNQRKGKEKVVEVLNFLGDYVVEHFQEEQALMRKHSYPDYESHVEQHQQFTRRLAALREEMEREGATVSLVIGTNQAVLRWLVEHIKRVDGKLGLYLQANP